MKALILTTSLPFTTRWVQAQTGGGASGKDTFHQVRRLALCEWLVEPRRHPHCRPKSASL